MCVQVCCFGQVLQLSAGFTIDDDVDVRHRLECRAESALSSPRTFCYDSHLSSFTREQRNDSTRFAEINGAQHDSVAAKDG